MRLIPLRASFLSGLAALSLALAPAACGGKEEPKATTATSTPAAADAGAGTGSGAGQRENGAAGANSNRPEDKSGGATGGTAPTPNPVTPKPLDQLPAATSSVMPEQPALSATSIATLPANVVAVAGTPSLKALVDAFMLQAKQVPGLAITNDPLPFVLDRLKALTGADVSWLAIDAPLRIAIPDPKKYPDGFVLVLPVVSDIKLAPTAFPNAKAKVDGHWAKLELAPGPDGRAVWLDLDDTTLTISSHASLTKDLGAFMKDLAAWTPADPLVLDGSVANAKVIFAGELAGMQQQVASITEQLGKAGLPPQQLEAMKTVAGGVFGMVEDLDRVGVALDPRGEFPRVALSIRAKAGTKLAGRLGEVATRKVGLAALVPPEAWLFVGYNIDLDGAMDLSSLTESLTKAPPPMTWTADEAKALVGLLGRLEELTTGNAAFWATTSDNFPMALEAAASVSDGKATREVLLGVLDALFQKYWGETRKQMVAAGMPESQIPGTAFPDFVSGAAKMTRMFGVVPNIPTTPGADTVALDFDWSRFGGGRIPAVFNDLLMKTVGSRLEVSLATAAERYTLAIGPHGASRAVELANAASDKPVTDAWLAKAAKDDFGVVMLRPARLMRAFVELPQLGGKRASIGKLPDDPAMLDFQSDGTTARAVLTVPTKLLLALINL